VQAIETQRQLTRAQPPARRVPGHRWFFPAATLYAILVVPASVAAMLGVISIAPGLASPAGHAHEMLFGFALAVVAGNQLGPRTRRDLALLVGSWLLARVAFVSAPGSVAAIATNVLFPALLAWRVAPRLVASAKKWRNQALPAALLAICASAVALTVTLALQRGASRAIVDVGVALFATLLLFMGGRLIAPTVAGQVYRQGGNLDARVQPRIEGALVVTMGLAVLALVVEAASTWQAVRWIAGVSLALAGVLASVRLLRWRLWRVWTRWDLLCLGAGYAWLAVGLVLFGLAHVRGMGRALETVAIHVITVGSLGTLTLNVMAMTHLLTLRRTPPASRLALAGTLLLGIATLSRALAGYAAAIGPLVVAAACWSGAYALLLVLLALARQATRAAAAPKERTPLRA
jgi:uncharacterized protein involved in response to NO